jgi:membrane protein
VFSAVWTILKETALAFVNDGALSRGAAIAFYTVTSIAPVLLIVIAIAGLAFGQDAAQNAITAQLSGLMGLQTAEVIQTAVASAAGKSSGILATIIGIGTLLVTASGVFGEMQTSLNAIWKAAPRGTTVSRLIRARAASLGLVAAMGFLLMVSLVVSTVLTAAGNYLDSILPFGRIILTVLNGVLSILLISLLFAAVFKILPDRDLEWSDVAVGAVVTAVLFTFGKSLISWYIGSSAVASSFGAAGALIVLLLWVYYSAQIFLLGAEFTKVWAEQYGSKQGTAAVTQLCHTQARLSGRADATRRKTKTAVAGSETSRMGRNIPQYLFDGLAISQLASVLAVTHKDFDWRIDDYLQKYQGEDRGTLIADLAAAAAEARRTVEALVAAPDSQWHDEGAAIESLTDVLLKAAEQSKPMWRRMVENYFTNTQTALIPDRVARARAHYIAAERLLMSRIEVAD